MPLIASYVSPPCKEKAKLAWITPSCNCYQQNYDFQNSRTAKLLHITSFAPHPGYQTQAWTPTVGNYSADNKLHFVRNQRNLHLVLRSGQSVPECSVHILVHNRAATMGETGEFIPRSFQKHWVVRRLRCGKTLPRSRFVLESTSVKRF